MALTTAEQLLLQVRDLDTAPTVTRLLAAYQRDRVAKARAAFLEWVENPVGPMPGWAPPTAQ